MLGSTCLEANNRIHSGETKDIIEANERIIPSLQADNNDNAAGQQIAVAFGNDCGQQQYAKSHFETELYQSLEFSLVHDRQHSFAHSRTEYIFERGCGHKTLSDDDKIILTEQHKFLV